MTKEEPADEIQPAPLKPPRPQTFPTNSLKANLHNPRVLCDEVRLQTLELSIRKVGVLVPLRLPDGRQQELHRSRRGNHREEAFSGPVLGLLKGTLSAILRPRRGMP